MSVINRVHRYMNTGERVRYRKIEPVLEAPGDEEEGETTEDEEELEAEDYNEDEETEDEPEVMEEEDEEELEAEDYNEDEETEDDPESDESDESKEEPDPEDDGDELESEDYSEEGGLESEDGDVTSDSDDESDQDENSGEDNQDNEEESSENDSKAESRNQSILHEDFINLHNTVRMFIERISTIDRSNIYVNKSINQIHSNLIFLRKTVWEYVVYDFYKVKYITNLYKYNHFVESLRVNVDMLQKTAEFVPDSQNK